MLRVERVIRRDRRGSSSPVVADTIDGLRFVKLAGASQGVLPLVAEIIVGGLADAIGVPVPARAPVFLPADVPSDDANDELRDLLEASAGVNLGFAFVEGARDLTAAEFERVDLVAAARVLWLDVLVQNLDRTVRNPNLMIRRGTVWAIDHGACLPFQHDWGAVSEATPRRVYDTGSHVFAWATPVLAEMQAQLAPLLTRERLMQVAADVPDAWLGDDPPRRRAAYGAVLWKRMGYLGERLA